MPDPGFHGSQLAFTTPIFVPQPDPLLGPLPITENMFMALEFDIQALNAFLNSGDFEALLGPQPAEYTALSPAQPVPSKRYPLLSDAIRDAWFSNLQEKDLESEAAQTGAPLDLRRKKNNGGQDLPRNIDEAWREKIKSDMVPKPFDIVGPLPSIEFLVSP